MTAANIVHHQHTSSVALSSRKERAGGGSLYIDMAVWYVTATPVYLRRGDERGVEGIRKCVRFRSLLLFGPRQLRMPVWASRSRVMIAKNAARRPWH